LTGDEAKLYPPVASEAAARAVFDPHSGRVLRRRRAVADVSLLFWRSLKVATPIKQSSPLLRTGLGVAERAPSFSEFAHGVHATRRRSGSPV